MYIVMAVFKNFQRPERVFDTKEEAEKYIENHKGKFNGYKVLFVEYGRGRNE